MYIRNTSNIMKMCGWLKETSHGLKENICKRYIFKMMVSKIYKEVFKLRNNETINLNKR
jgi:hypothetical protein